MKKLTSALLSTALVLSMLLPGQEVHAVAPDTVLQANHETGKESTVNSSSRSSVSGNDMSNGSVSGNDADGNDDSDDEIFGNSVSGNDADGAAALYASVLYPEAGSRMELKSSYSVGVTNEDGGVAEIVKYNKDNQKMYVVSGQLQSLDIVAIGKNGETSLEKRIPVGELGTANGFDAGDITSVDINTERDIIALAVQSTDYTAKGTIVILEYNGNYVTKFDAGIQPDMICFSPDGNYLLTANEGEPRMGYKTVAADPAGSITLVELKEKLSESSVVQCGFDAFDSQRDALVSDKVLLKKNTPPSVDLEPEYIAVTADSRTAYISLQENNAIAALDIRTGTITSVKGLGFKNHNLNGNELDLNKDSKINIQNEDVYGVYMPDGLAVVRIDGITYLLTPNEGDAREWEDYVNFDSKAINGSKKKVEYLLSAETDGLDPDKTYIFGGRSFSIFRADTMELVWDSGSEFEKITADRFPEYFNTNHKETELEGRSNKKGPEPEDIKVLTVGDHIYAYIGLERMGGVMMYDITDPSAPVFADYLNNRKFTESDLSLAGDLGAEGICTVEARYSPFGYPMVLVANEISGTVSVIALKEGKYEETDSAPNVKPDEKPQTNSRPGLPTQADWNTVESTVSGMLNSIGNSTLAAEGNAATANFVTGSRTVVPHNILALIQGKPVTAAFHTAQSLAFSISGLNMTKEAAGAADSLNLTVEQGDNLIPEAVTAQNLKDTVASRQLTLQHNAVFGIPVNMHFALGKENAGRSATLYYYTKLTGRLEKQAAYLITEEGQAMFAVPKGGSYLVTVK